MRSHLTAGIEECQQPSPARLGQGTGRRARSAARHGPASVPRVERKLGGMRSNARSGYVHRVRA